MTNDASLAMATWVGALAEGGVLTSGHAEAGATVAAYVVGAERLASLRAWMTEQSPEVVAREKHAAIELCIYMANADRNLDPEESFLLQRIVSESGLDEDAIDGLVAQVHAPTHLDGLETRLTHPVLRELMLALAWELACSDGAIDEAESAVFDELVTRLAVDPARAEELKDAMTARLSAPPEA